MAPLPDAAPTAATIRPAEPRDRDMLVAQHRALNVHEAAIHPDRRTDVEGGVLSFEAAAERVEATGGVVLVAEIDGVVAGHLILSFEEGPAYLLPEERPHAHVSALFVEPEARGHGIARRLIAAAEEIARARGRHRMLLSVQAGNAGAEATYARLGFSPYSIDLIKDLRPSTAGDRLTGASAETRP